MANKKRTKGEPKLARVYQPSQYERYAESFSSLSAPRLARIIKDAKAGYFSELMELLSDICMKDTHIKGIYRTRRLAVSSEPFEILAASDSAEDKAIAQFVREALDYSDNFNDLRVQLTDAIGKGFAASEVIWELVDDEKIYPTQFVWIPQKMFALGENADELLLRLEPFGKPEKLPERKIIVHRQPEDESVLASGVLVTCLWYHLFKVWTLKDWAGFIEVYGTPMRIGKYEPAATEDEIKVLTEAVINIAKSAGAVISKATEIEFVEANRQASSDAYERFANFLNREMSKAVLGQTLTTEPSERGTQALGVVQENVRYDIKKDDARRQDDTLNRTLVAWLVDFNFGPQKRYPKIKTKTEPAEDMKRKSEVYKTLAEMGYKIPAEHVATTFGVPVEYEDKNQKLKETNEQVEEE